MTALRIIYELFPPRTRERIKAMLSVEGHGTSWLDPFRARDYARGKKRMDVVAENLAAKFAAAGIRSLRGASCLEFGAGQMPTETLVFHVLGAERCVATDYNAIARIEVLPEAAHAANRARVLAALNPFADGLDLEGRLDELLGMTTAAASAFLRQRVAYVAPFDMSLAPTTQKFDVIHSTSVLEHLPVAQAEAILRNLAASLIPGGQMIHEVDLRDHRDFEGGPFAFLSKSDNYNPQTDYDIRGNRLRKQDWLNLLDAVPGTRTQLLFTRKLSEDLLPADLVEFAAQVPSDELRISWIGLQTVANGSAAAA
jgi:SAM-dependent methyltransferase